ncbi:hypothetical protein BD779DRAFT_599280 [Infundibulicybe gibba]|nr:hypothetical protein BD779DRAFT_599280 [Infundibulicybe gibba]
MAATVMRAGWPAVNLLEPLLDREGTPDYASGLRFPLISCERVNKTRFELDTTRFPFFHFTITCSCLHQPTHTPSTAVIRSLSHLIAPLSALPVLKRSAPPPATPEFSVTALTAILRPPPLELKTHAHAGLARGLRDGVEDRWSQVWMAWVHPPDNRRGHVVSSDGAEVSPAPVVMKIVQPSLLPIPDRAIRPEFYYRSPEGVAEEEMQTYKRFRSIQGDVVPYFFGMQKLEMPSGEDAWVLFLEYIGGPTLLQIAEDMRARRLYTEASHEVEKVPLPMLCQIYVSALSRIFDIARLDVLPWNIHVSNMVLPLDMAGVVFIDFANVEFGSGYSEFFKQAIERAFGAISAKSISLE